MNLFTIIVGFSCLFVGAMAGFLIGRKHPKIADAIAGEANKIAGK